MPFATSLLAAAGYVVDPMLLHRADWQEYSSTRSIWRNARTLSCETALKELNKLAQQEEPKVLLLAGDLSALGPCIEWDSKKAAVYYEVALEKNEQAALPRLVQIHARDGRDPVGTMRWAHARPDMVPQACRVSAPPAHAKAFAAEVNAWPQGRLLTCVQHAHVTFNLWDYLSYVKVEGMGKRVPVEATLNAADGTLRWRDVRKDQLVGVKLNSFDAPEDGLPALLWMFGQRALQQYGALEMQGGDWTVKLTIEVERPFPRSPRTLFIDVAN